jgi:hypothetical protein
MRGDEEAFDSSLVTMASKVPFPTFGNDPSLPRFVLPTGETPVLLLGALVDGR